MGEEFAFGSMEWLDSYVKLFNEHPDLEQALSGLTAKVVYEFSDRPDIKPKYTVIKNGTVVDHGEVSGDDGPDYVVKADYGVWKAMTVGELDPMNAVMSGKARVEGNMAALLKHVEGFKQTFDVVQQVPTVFD